MNTVNVARHNLLLTVAKLIERNDRPSIEAAEDLLVVLRRLAELEATVEALQRCGRTAVLESAHGDNGPEFSGKFFASERPHWQRVPATARKILKKMSRIVD